MRLQASKPKFKKIEGISAKVQLNAKNDQKLILFMKIIRLDAYFQPIKGLFLPFVNDLRRIDEIAKRFFPIAFLIFNILFWTRVNNQQSIENQLIEDGFIKFYSNICL